MAEFTPRTSAPSATDKHWIKSTKGGLNDCIEISGGSVLPNCVGYAWGRFREIIGEKPKLSTGNAENWYPNTSDGYERSDTPKLGAVACWRKGQEYNESDGCGHVAIVEEILENGDIVCSNSAYGGTRFYVNTYEKSAGYNSGALTFQGFILPPVEFEETTEDPEKPVVIKATSTAIKVGDTVTVNSGAKTYDGGSLASFVYGTKYTVSEVKGDRVVINSGNVVVAAVKAADLTVVSSAASTATATTTSATTSTDTSTIKVGDTVTVNNGAKTYDGGSLASFVYGTKYTVQELVRDRAVIGLNGAVTAAVNVGDLTRV